MCGRWTDGRDLSHHPECFPPGHVTSATSTCWAELRCRQQEKMARAIMQG